MDNFYCFLKEHILNGFAARVNLSGGEKLELAFDETDVPEGKLLSLVKTEENEAYFDRFEIRVRLSRESAVLSLDACVRRGAGLKRAFLSEDGVSFTLGSGEADAMTASAHDGNAWWMLPHFYGKQEPDLRETGGKVQSLLLKYGKDNVHLLLLTGDNFRAEISGNTLGLSSGAAGLYRLSGAFLAVSWDREPQQAVSKNAAFAVSTGAVRVPLRTNRFYPAIFEGFGFCTWNCCYFDVTSAKVYAKLDELKEKKVPVRWIIIDDGWLSVQDGKLTAFTEDRAKFPEGFKAFIAKVKGEYGVGFVGVWHAFQGYWEGVEPGSELFKEQRENLTETSDGLWIPSLDEEKAFAFWDCWHSYLASCGVDFVKVDNQSSHSSYIEGITNTAEGCRIAHRALERSVYRNFGDCIINCMGMDMDSVFARPHTAVSRISDDFYPKKPRSFVKHLIQNVYNAVCHNEFYYCDFDMWWSDHESAVQSGVLRAISGSPVYVSDETGHTDPARILPVVEDDGTLMRCDYAARPTADRMYTDCVKEERLLTVWNRSDEAFALAAFNVSEKNVTDLVNFGAIPELPEGPFMAYEYFSKVWRVIDRDTALLLSVPQDEVRLFSIYPIYNDETGDDYILAGGTDRYLPIASKKKEKLYIKEIIKEQE